MGIERYDEQVDDVQRDGKVGDQLGPRDQQQDGDDAVFASLAFWSSFYFSTRGWRERTRGTEKGGVYQEEGLRGTKPYKAIRHPTDPQHPPDGRIASQALPPQHQLGAERPAGHQCREEDQRCPAHVVDCLQQEDLR